MSLLESLLFPHSVAVIGASPKQGKVGYAVLANMASFEGEVYPVNPKHERVLGVKCYSTILDTPPCDMAVVVVPAAVVPGVIEQCGMAGVKVAVVISAGFKESGVEGFKLERMMLEAAEPYNLRILGPNCLGVANPRIGLNATFGATMPEAGTAAVLSQSGALLTSIMDWAQSMRLGFSAVLSLGNKADISENDILTALKEDDDTGFILGYIEGASDGKEMIEVAKELTAHKPVVFLKAGRTVAGSRAVSSHTGSLAGSDAAYEAAFRQCGILRAYTLEELFDIAMLLSATLPPVGNRIGVLTNAGGLGIMASDACVLYGLELAKLSPPTIKELKETLSPAASFYNPVDVLGDAEPQMYSSALSALHDDEGVDAVVCLTSPQAMTDVKAVAQAVATIQTRKPVLACLVGGSRMGEGVDTLREKNIPTYPYPERAMFSLGKVNALGSEEYEDEVVHFEVERARAREIIQRALDGGRTTLGVQDIELLRAYGIPVSPSILARDIEEALSAARSMGYPVVLKVVSPQISHKTDVKGVMTDISSAQGLETAYSTLMAMVRRYAKDAVVEGVLVQRMEEGREVILGATEDSQFGRLLMFGLGGVYVEVLKDVAFRVSPIGHSQALRMIKEIKAYPLLSGVRGEPAYDVGAVAVCIQRLCQLMEDNPELVELDINPMIVHQEGEGCVAVDFRATLKR
ncbi:MAG: acetate--CoA ligase family protein [Methermicoccaceae archaeon]